MATRKYLAQDGSAFDTAKQADSHDEQQPHHDAVVGLGVHPDLAGSVVQHFVENFRQPKKRAPKAVKNPPATTTSAVAENGTNSKKK